MAVFGICHTALLNSITRESGCYNNDLLVLGVFNNAVPTVEVIHKKLDGYIIMDGEWGNTGKGWASLISSYYTHTLLHRLSKIIKLLSQDNPEYKSRVLLLHQPAQLF
jgi:hypothetical protein